MRSLKGMGALTALVAAAMFGFACGGTGNTGSSCTKTYNVGLVTDVGKLSDKSFNANAWKGVQDAQSDSSLCVKAKVIESTQPTDYQKNMQLFIDQKYDMIVTVGFLLGDDTLAVAKANPTTKFAIVDYAYDKPPANLVGLVFREDQAGFLAGIVAGKLTKSNTIGGVYGLDIPPVHKYRVGYENGAKYANPSIKTLGVYQPPSGAKSFNDPDWGKQQATAMFGQGADIVFGAGGNTGNGALLAAVQANKMCVGVDVDQFESYPDAQKCLVTSAEKHIAFAVKTAISDMVKNTWPSSGLLSFDAANGGVGVSPFHNYDSQVPADVKQLVKDALKKLADGSLQTGYKG
ncbi:MAG TPA: BMP family ABC transporter substrate-binding protein [Candidatus Dormibacteraeota bacterium]|jgi:basic membrane protein A